MKWLKKRSSLCYLIYEVKSITSIDKGKKRKGLALWLTLQENLEVERKIWSTDILYAELHLRGFDYRLWCHLLRMLVTLYVMGSIFSVSTFCCWSCSPQATRIKTRLWRPVVDSEITQVLAERWRPAYSRRSGLNVPHTSFMELVSSNFGIWQICSWEPSLLKNSIRQEKRRGSQWY